MPRSAIPFDQFCLPVIDALGDRWMLLAAGRFSPPAFNMMTVSWGGLGVIWNKPMAMVVVRPSRYTYQFMESSGTFTLSAFSSEYRDALTLCGTRSGRSVDKVRASGLTPCSSLRVEAPGFDEAELILECRKMYYEDISPARFLSAEIEDNYGDHDYHRLYLAEILAIQGTDAYRRQS